MSQRMFSKHTTALLQFYSLTQGTQFIALAYLPAVTVNIVLSFTTVIVALSGSLLLGERPAGLQWFGVGLSLVGAFVYFYPVSIPAGQTVGIAAAVIGVASNAAAVLLGRSVNRSGDLAPFTVTLVSMGIGSAALLAAGAATQGWPRLTPIHWAIVGWLFHFGRGGRGVRARSPSPASSRSGSP